jgi:hypothetical protein
LIDFCRAQAWKQLDRHRMQDEGDQQRSADGSGVRFP